MHWSSIGDVVWYTIVIFAFVAYLLLLFMILGDLFRDRKLAVGWKVVWIIFLVVIPYLTAFTYIVTRGRGMSERLAQANKDADAAAREYIQNAVGTSPADDIAKAKGLLDAGVITPEEFERLKSRALAV